MSRRIPTIICFCISLLSIATGCKREHVPDNLIDTATMTSILTEYYLIEGYDYVVASRHKDSLDYQSHAAKDSLLSKYKVSQADIDSSLAYYVRHPRVFEAIMNRAISTLDSRSKSIELTPREDGTQDETPF